MSEIDIIIIGAGGHAAELQDYLQFANSVLGKNTWNILGFLDDNPENYKIYQFNSPYLGNIKNHPVDKLAYYIMGIANLNYRKPIIEKFLEQGAKFQRFVHPTAFVSSSARIGEGTVVGPFVNIGPNVTIGSFNLINSRCSLGHDTILGSFNFICPNVSFSGFTNIGDNNLFGINSATIPKISISNNNTVAAGMTLDKNVGSGETVFYRFKERIIAITK